MLMDAAIVVDEDGVIFAVYDMKDDGAEDTMADLLAQGVELSDCRGKLIMPGFVDGHAHAPQVPLCMMNVTALSCVLLSNAVYGKRYNGRRPNGDVPLTGALITIATGAFL